MTTKWPGDVNQETFFLSWTGLTLTELTGNWMPFATKSSLVINRSLNCLPLRPTAVTATVWPVRGNNTTWLQDTTCWGYKAPSAWILSNPTIAKWRVLHLKLHVQGEQGAQKANCQLKFEKWVDESSWHVESFHISSRRSFCKRVFVATFIPA